MIPKGTSLHKGLVAEKQNKTKQSHCVGKEHTHTKKDIKRIIAKL